MGCSVRIIPVLAVALLGVTPAVAADPVDQCIDAFEKAQVERTGGRLTRARKLLALCSSQSCPTEIRQDCREWLFELEPRIPTIVLRARVGEGADVADVKVYANGELLAKRLDGRPVRVDPGVLRLRWEYAGYPPVETEIIVREGEKVRFVSATFAPKAEPLPPEKLEPVGPKVPAGAWVAGGVGVAGLVSFAALGLSVKARERELENDCKPHCTDEQVQPLERQAILANVSLGVGIAGLAVASWLLLSADAAEHGARRRRTAVGLGVGPHGARAVLRLRF